MNFVFFLKEIKKKWLLFYYFCIIFIVGTFISAFIVRVTLPPFYTFNMYSFVFPENSKTYFFKLEVNNKDFNTFSLTKNQGDHIRCNINRFIFLEENNYKDHFYEKIKTKLGNTLPDIIYDKLFFSKKNNKKFISWLKGYLEYNTRISVKSLRIYKIELKLNQQIKPIVYKKHLFLDYK